MQAFPSASSPISAEVARQAVQWWLQLNSGKAQARQHDGLQRWRAASPEHEAAWQRIESMGSQMAGIPMPLARAALAEPGSAGRRRAVQALAVLLVSGAGSAAVVRSQAWSKTVTAKAVAKAYPSVGTVKRHVEEQKALLDAAFESPRGRGDDY